MRCPVCEVDLQMTERQGVEIDYCPKCRGIWLDRGELDKILERAAKEDAGRFDRRDDDRYDERHGKPRKQSFLQQLFD